MSLEREIIKENKLIVIFICELKRKNNIQLQVLNKLGYLPIVFVHSNVLSSLKNACANTKVNLLHPSFIKRLIQIITFYKKNKITHTEIYGGSRFAFLYLLVSKFFKVPVLNIERGSLNEFINKNSGLNKTARFSNFVLYKLSDYTWYKEFYMKAHLEQLNAKNLIFIPNCISVNNQLCHLFHERKIDYLWVNRIIPIRHIDWVISVSKLEQFKDKKFLILGFLDDEYARQKRKEIESLIDRNVTLGNYTEDIHKFYNESKYFLLPSDYVYGNNSLLESMSLGVVPIVSNVEGTESIILNNINGLTFTNNEESFISKMIETLNIQSKEWSNLSTLAIEKLKLEYGIKQFENKIAYLYEKIRLRQNL